MPKPVAMKTSLAAHLQARLSFRISRSALERGAHAKECLYAGLPPLPWGAWLLRVAGIAFRGDVAKQHLIAGRQLESAVAVTSKFLTRG